MNKVISAIAGLGLALGATTANAAVFNLTDQTEFENLTSADFGVDFEGIVSDTDFDLRDSHTINGVTFAPNNDNDSLICGRNAGCIGGDLGSSVYVVNNNSTILDILLPSNISAFSGFFGNLVQSSVDTTFEVYDAANNMIYSGDFSVNGGFIGLIAAGGEMFSRIRITSPEFFLTLDDLTFGTAALNNDNVVTTPLPAALPIFLAGLGAIGAFGKRRRKQA